MYLTLGDDEEMLAARERPAPLFEVASPQVRVLWNIVEKIDVLVPAVQILDLPVPKMVGAVPVTVRILQRTLEQIDGHDVEQLDVVPKLSIRV